jgi:hypothetical protein
MNGSVSYSKFELEFGLSQGFFLLISSWSTGISMTWTIPLTLLFFGTVLCKHKSEISNKGVEVPTKSLHFEFQ